MLIYVTKYCTPFLCDSYGYRWELCAADHAGALDPASHRPGGPRFASSSGLGLNSLSVLWSSLAGGGGAALRALSPFTVPSAANHRQIKGATVSKGLFNQNNICPWLSLRVYSGVLTIGPIWSIRSTSGFDTCFWMV